VALAPGFGVILGSRQYAARLRRCANTRLFVALDESPVHTGIPFCCFWLLYCQPQGFTRVG
jgi:hypothetical protein